MEIQFKTGRQMKENILLIILISLFLLCYEKTFCQSKTIKYNTSFSIDTSKINGFIKTANDYVFAGKLAAAMTLAKSANTLSNKINYKKGSAVSLNLKGRILYRTASFDSAILFSKAALILAQDLNDSALQSSAYLNIGNCYFTKGNDTQSMDYYFRGLAIEEKFRIPSTNLYGFLNNLGGIFINQKNYKKGLEFLLKSKAVAEQTKNLKRLATVYHNLGSLYIKFKNYNEAKICFEKSYKLAKEMNDIYTMNIHPSDMAEVYALLKEYDKAYFYAQENLKLAKNNGFKDQISVTLMTLSNIQAHLGKYKEAEKTIQEALVASEEIKTEQVTKDVYLQMADLYDKLGDYQKAYDYYKLFSTIKDTILNQQNSKLITEMNTKYTTEKKEKEIELLKKNEDIQKLELTRKENELDRQRTVSISIFLGFLLLMIVAILLYSRYRLKKKANDQLQNAYNLIEEKNVVIEKSNRMITDSITYAKRIQDAILPDPKDLGKLLPSDFFILYQPAQIVSGDFYWCSSQHNKIIFVVADCTGHGVPGAFMSMIGNTLLNEIVNERKITDTQKIAELLDEKIIYALHQYEDSQQYDGMDISICCIDPSANEIRFTGGNHAMYLYSDKVIKMKGNPFSIGGAQQQHSKVFTSQKISYQKGQNIYFLTDGYCDQSGGNSNKRYTSRRFEAFLMSIQHLAMDNQQKELEQALEKWKGSTKQRDDILVVGIKC
jgi:serine phosphatase RsbU (regulator of sigma subunit)/Tfp pilus assembly protein PilF